MSEKYNTSEKNFLDSTEEDFDINEESLMKLRTFNNPLRNTQLKFATVSLEDLDLRNPVIEKEIINIINQIYGENKVAFKPLEDFDDGIANHERLWKEVLVDLKYFIDDSNQTEMVWRLSMLMGGPGYFPPAQEGHYAWEGGYTNQFLILRKVGKKLLILPAPVVHTVTGGIGRQDKQDVFDGLKSILERGFVSDGRYGIQEGNSTVRESKEQRFNDIITGWQSEKGITKGDSFSLEIIPDSEKGRSALFEARSYAPTNKENKGSDYLVKEAKIESISSVNIVIASTATESEIEEKMDFYMREIFEKYHIPIRFFIDPEKTGFTGETNNARVEYIKRMVRVFPSKK